MSKTYFFYFTHLFLQNTHISLSIIHIYSNKIFISLTQPNSHCHHHLPPFLSRLMPLASHYATRSTPESTQANHPEIPKKTSKKRKEKKKEKKRETNPVKKLDQNPRDSRLRTRRRTPFVL